ncbi:DUF6113 family protein [Streptomyces sp. NPDC058572]|uniref:DUF6113 family protein n=1 Tax=Streptomyces sp. NPDC058572 TaxID=3346546 RepID=UPI00365E62D3
MSARKRPDNSGASGTSGASGSRGARRDSGAPDVPGGWLTRPPGAPHPGLVAAYLVLVVLGAVVGVAGTLVQGAWFPGGLLLALLGSAALFYGALRACGTQLGVASAAIGWLLAVVVLSFGRPEGDGVFAAGIGPLVFMLGGMVLAVMCATMSRSLQPGGRPGGLEG